MRAELAPDQAVVGFCGGPFTVAGYLVEGKPSRDFAVTKALMYREPAVWHALLEKLAETFAAYVGRAGPRRSRRRAALRLLGGRPLAGRLRRVRRRRGRRRVLAALRDAGVPSIHFGTGTATLLPAMAAAGGDVIGLDWRIPLDDGWALAGEDRAVQGNLDPAVLLGPWERIEAAALDVLARAGGRPGHIFNLGHGVLPATDPDVLGRLLRARPRSRSVRRHRLAGAATTVRQGAVASDRARSARP